MKKNPTEIYQGKEVFKNGNFSKYPTLHAIISDKSNELNELIGIRVSAEHGEDRMEQYNIETQRFITNITNHNGLDLLLTQYNKITKTHEAYSPYSNPGYMFFVDLLVGYYELNKNKPKLNFPRIYAEGNYTNRMEYIPLVNEIDAIRGDMGLYVYLNHQDFFKEDSNGIRHAVLPHTEGNDREGIGFQGDTTIMKLENYKYENNKTGTANSASTIIVENQLIPIYLQAFIDTNRNVANLKKIYEMLFYVLDTGDSEDYGAIWRNTPII